MTGQKQNMHRLTHLLLLLTPGSSDPLALHGLSPSAAQELEDMALYHHVKTNSKMANWTCPKPKARAYYIRISWKSLSQLKFSGGLANLQATPEISGSAISFDLLLLDWLE